MNCVTLKVIYGTVFGIVVLVTCTQAENVTPPKVRVILFRQKNQGVEILHEAPNSDVRLSFSRALALNLTEVIRLECNADYPIQWTYESLYGAPEYGTEELMEVVKLDPNHNNISVSTFAYQATVTFRNLREGNTGKYTCTGISYPEQQSYFNVYMLGQTPFLRPKSDYIEFNDAESSSLYIPCVITDNYLLQVSLHKGELEDLSTDQAIYEPFVGFKLNVSAIGDPYDKYTCKSTLLSFNDTAGPVYTTFFVVRPIEPDIVKATPKENYIAQRFPSETITFTCRSKVIVQMKVTINGTLPITRPDLIENEVVSHPDDADGWIFWGIVTIPSSVTWGRFVEIQCLKLHKDDRRILHVWEYSPKGENDIVQFNYEYKEMNATDGSYDFKCCTRSFHEPILRWSPCGSSSSCNVIRQKSLSSLARENVEIEVDLDMKCAKWRLNSKQYGYAFLQCSLQLNYEENNLSSKKTILYSNSELQPHNFVLLDDEFSLPPIETILVIQKLSSPNIVGIDNQFMCVSNSLYFARGLQWGIKYKDGTTQIISEDHVVGTEASNFTINYRISYFALHSFDIIAVICMAPLSNFSDWKYAYTEVEVINTGVYTQASQLYVLIALIVSLHSMTSN